MGWCILTRKGPRKKLKGFFGIRKVDLGMLIFKISNAHLIFQNLGQRKMIKNNIKKYKL
jgi:hypothetical protein